MRKITHFLDNNHQSPCEPNPCANGATCIVEGDSYSCKCPPGWKGFHCEEKDRSKHDNIFTFDL